MGKYTIYGSYGWWANSTNISGRGKLPWSKTRICMAMMPGKSFKNILPNGGLMVMSPMVLWVKSKLKQIKSKKKGFRGEDLRFDPFFSGAFLDHPGNKSPMNSHVNLTEIFGPSQVFTWNLTLRIQICPKNPGFPLYSYSFRMGFFNHQSYSIGRGEGILRVRHSLIFWWIMKYPEKTSGLFWGSWEITPRCHRKLPTQRKHNSKCTIKRVKATQN